MLNAIAAEALKFKRHRATWGLVWIWPIGLTLIWMLAIGAELSGAGGEAGGDGRGGPTAAAWIADNIGFWGVPGHTFGRYIIGAFVAVVFAGEYGWNTWKLIVPHRARTTLIAAKYAISFILLAIGFTLAALLFNLFGWAEDVVTGDPIPAGVAFGALLKAHGAGALAALPAVLLTMAYVSLAAILTRSTVAALVIGLVVTTVEQLFFNFAPMFEPYAPSLIGAFYQVLPGYHVANAANVISQGPILEIPFPSGTFSTSFATSLAIVGAWTVVMVALTFWSFRRQDIN
jgi:ABC-type transport system involved in multi-copper enzyme maturation permease subunit